MQKCKEEHEGEPLAKDPLPTSELLQCPESAGGETVPTDSGSSATHERSKATQCGRYFLRADQIQSDITFGKVCLKNKGRKVQLDEGTTACSYCGTANHTASQFTESLRKATDDAAAESYPTLTTENLLQIDRDACLPLGKID